MSAAETHSALYEGTVRHRRFQPRSHEFAYRMFMLYLDLAEIESLLPESIWWSRSRRAIARFDRRDYFGDADVPLDEAIRRRVAEDSGRRPSGPIRLLTHGRYYGYCFNPVSFYYCFDEAGETIESIVADITNTPWKEKHAYVLEPGKESGSMQHRFRFGKAFHVSPFMPMNQDYDWRFSHPSTRLSAHFESYQGGKRVFDATLTLERSTLNPASLRRAVTRYPFMTMKVIGAIHWQALKLFMKRVPFHEHPKHATSGNGAKR